MSYRNLTPEEDRKLRLQFIAELYQVATDESTLKGQRRALQAYCDALTPWLSVADDARRLRSHFELFAHVEVESETAEDAVFLVTLSPEAELYFQAWISRQRFDPYRDPPL